MAQPHQAETKSYYTSCSQHDPTENTCGDIDNDNQLYNASHLNDHWKNHNEIIATELELLASRCEIDPSRLEAICPKHRRKFNWRNDSKQCRYRLCSKNENLLRASKNLSLKIKRLEHSYKFPLLGYVCSKCRKLLSNYCTNGKVGKDDFLDVDPTADKNSAATTNLGMNVYSSANIASEPKIANNTNTYNESGVTLKSSKLGENQQTEPEPSDKEYQIYDNVDSVRDSTDQLSQSPSNESNSCLDKTDKKSTNNTMSKYPNNNASFRNSHYSDTQSNQYKSNDDSYEASSKLSVTNQTCLRGFFNDGNTCFMNSALQCIIRIPELRDFFLSENWSKSLNRNNPLGSGGKVAKEFASLLEYLMLPSAANQSVSAKYLKNAVAKFNPIFFGYRQQDPHQFLNSLLDALHEDLKTDERSDSSIISKLFHGITISIIKCKSYSHLCEPNPEDLFSSLSLSIPTKPHLTLDQCFLDFSSEQYQTKNSEWYCSKCGQLSESIMQTYIKTLPPILIIHFKRFNFNPESYEHISTSIEYPYKLDIPPCKPWRLTSTKYELQSVGLKRGSLLGGHAYTYAKVEDGKWYRFNDSSVTPIDELNDVISRDAYILVYRQLKEPCAKLDHE